jgi:Ca2+-binding EF-hand superfamily protein
MTRMTKLTLAISAAALSIGGIAYAQMPKDHKSMMDTDGNGVVTRAEAQNAATTMFTMMDANKDGKLDTADREMHRSEMRGKMFDGLDTDKSGSLSRDEFMNGKHHGMHGDMADGEGMGGAGMGGSGKGDHEHHGKKERGMDRGHGGMMMQMADANGDGAVTRDELLAGAMKHFDMADTNKDGQISAAEHDAAREKMKSEWQAKKAEWRAQKSAS